MGSESYAYDALRWRQQQSIPTCVRHIAAAGGIRRECSQHTINQSRVPQARPSQPRCNNSNKLHLYKALERGTIDQRRTWEYGDRGKGVLVGLHRDLSSSSLSSCDAALERRKGCANILTDWLQSGSAYAHPSSQASISRRDGEGAMGPFARPRAPREQHRRDTANHRCACASARGRVSPPVQLLQSCGLRSEGDKACATQTPRSRTEQQEQQDRAARGEEEG